MGEQLGAPAFSTPLARERFISSEHAAGWYLSHRLEFPFGLSWIAGLYRITRVASLLQKDKTSPCARCHTHPQIILSVTQNHPFGGCNALPYTLPSQKQDRVFSVGHTAGEHSACAKRRKLHYTLCASRPNTLRVQPAIGHLFHYVCCERLPLLRDYCARVARNYGRITC